MNTLPFGKHRGQPLSMVPCGYLRWWREHVYFDDEELRTAIQETIDAHEEEKRNRPQGIDPVLLRIALEIEFPTT